MLDRPSEHDQVKMVTKNLQTHMKKHLIALPIRTFKDLFDTGLQVEDAIHAGDLDKAETSVARPKRFGGSGVNPIASIKATEVNALDSQV